MLLPTCPQHGPDLPQSTGRRWRGCQGVVSLVSKVGDDVNGVFRAASGRFHFMMARVHRGKPSPRRHGEHGEDYAETRTLRPRVSVVNTMPPVSKLAELKLK
jgi:hypothetical protein